jgi:Ca2+/Na+ antiporter
MFLNGLLNILLFFLLRINKQNHKNAQLTLKCQMRNFSFIHSFIVVPFKSLVIVIYFVKTKFLITLYLFICYCIVYLKITFKTIDPLNTLKSIDFTVKFNKITLKEGKICQKILAI